MELARQLVADYGYLAVFIGTFLEGELVLVCAGVAAAHGLLAAPGVMAVAALGAWTGHVVFFGIGRYRGRDWLFRHPRLGSHAKKADDVITGYGWASVFILQYLYGARLAGAILFGFSSFPVARFLALQSVNCVSWAILVTLVGYLLGNSLEMAANRIGWVSAAVVVTVLAITAATIWRRRSRP